MKVSWNTNYHKFFDRYNLKIKVYSRINKNMTYSDLQKIIEYLSQKHRIEREYIIDEIVHELKKKYGELWSDQDKHS